MMAHKAGLFADNMRYQQIMAPSDWAERKVIGRAVSSFNEDVCNMNHLGFVHEDILCKFGQNLNFSRFFLEMGDKILAEASPYDGFWGIGFRGRRPAGLPTFALVGVQHARANADVCSTGKTSPPPTPSFSSDPSCRHLLPLSARSPFPPTKASRRQLVPSRSNHRVVCSPSQEDSWLRCAHPKPAHCFLRLRYRNIDPTL